MSGVKAVVSTSTLDVASSIASAVPPLIQSTLADPAKFIGIQISYYIDYILVSFVTAFSVSYFFNSSPLCMINIFIKLISISLISSKSITHTNNMPVVTRSAYNVRRNAMNNMRIVSENCRLEQMCAICHDGIHGIRCVSFALWTYLS